MVLFSGTVEIDGVPTLIEATTDDDTRTIIHTALDIEFWGDIPVFDEFAMHTDEMLPEKYIFFDVVSGYFNRHGSNRPLMAKTHFDVTFVTKDQILLRSIPKRIRNSLFSKGFKCVSTERDLTRDEKTEYFAVVQEFVWIGGV